MSNYFSSLMYYTHDNGARPFRVDISSSVVKVYKQDETEDYEADALCSFDPQHIFIGQSPLNAMTSFSGAHGHEFDGNSILLELTDGKYVFIGHSIFEFTPQFEIVKYVSPVGNNNVPYPYAVDTNGNYYLMIEDVILSQVPDDQDPYTWYYNTRLITKDRSYVPPKDPKIKNFQGIQDYYINYEQYTLTYYPHPETDYDRLTSNGEQMYLVDTDGVRTLLSKINYIGLMGSFGDQMGFRPLIKRILSF